ncbi:MAG: hypothetical protein AAF638_07045 [Pseudomonadota bacterium]
MIELHKDDQPMTKPFFAAISVVALTVGCAAADPVEVAKIERATVLEFGLDDTLFIADSAQGKLFAYDLPDGGAAPSEDAAFNLLDMDKRLSTAIEFDTGSLTYNDLAVHPVTRDAYISLTFTQGGEPGTAVVAVNRAGDVDTVDLDSLSPTVFELQDAADETVTVWRDIPAPTLTVTDLDYVDGELFVSGLSTGEFASTLRRVPVPFDGTSSATAVEIYHAAHAQMETRAPIRAMTVIDLDGVQTVVAAYTCTPLVTIPTADLEDGAMVTGNTIAELGYGNTPLEVIAFSAADMQGNIGSYVLVVNREMDADLITTEAMGIAAAGEGLSDPIPYLGATAGVQTTPLPLSGVLHAADQDNQFILSLRRDLDTGNMELVSFRKGSFFRLSDFISEYNFPDYVYADTEMSQGTRMFQNMLKVDEDFADQTR